MQETFILFFFMLFFKNHFPQTDNLVKDLNLGIQHADILQLRLQERIFLNLLELLQKRI